MHITHSLVEAFLRGPGVPNPAPMAPPGIQGSVSNIVAYVKWGVLLVIMLVGFISAGAVAGVRISSEPRLVQGRAGNDRLSGPRRDRRYLRLLDLGHGLRRQL